MLVGYRSCRHFWHSFYGGQPVLLLFITGLMLTTLLLPVTNAGILGTLLNRVHNFSSFSSSASEAESREPFRRLPDAIIIGAKKCGTRALLEFLRLNPRVQAPGPEVHFFDKHFHLGTEWYRSRMPAVRLDQLVLEKSPSYFVCKAVPQRVYSLNPTIKLILVVRDPITRAISDFTQTHSALHRRTNIGRDLLQNDTLSAESFERLVFCATQKMTNFKQESWKIKKQCVNGVNTTVGVIRIGVYHRHLANWLQRFPLRQIHVIDGEALVGDPAPVLRGVERFLGLEPVIHDEHFVRDPIKGFQCVRNGTSTHCLPNSKGRPHAEVGRDTLERLRRFYAPENEKFFRLINRRFNWF